MMMKRKEGYEIVSSVHVSFVLDVLRKGRGLRRVGVD